MQTSILPLCGVGDTVMVVRESVHWRVEPMGAEPSFACRVACVSPVTEHTALWHHGMKRRTLHHEVTVQGVRGERFTFFTDANSVVKVVAVQRAA